MQKQLELNSHWSYTIVPSPSRPSRTRYVGHINITPRLTLLDTFKVIAHPSDDDMRHYILEGQRAAWPRIAALRSSLATEQALVWQVPL